MYCENKSNARSCLSRRSLCLRSMSSSMRFLFFVAVVVWEDPDEIDDVDESFSGNEISGINKYF